MFPQDAVRPQMEMHARVAATYAAAADTLDSLPFWHHFGQETIARLPLRAGGRVLDLCCGTGASALPAAQAVGPAGTVIGVDLTDALVRQARAKAASLGLGQATFRSAPVESLAFAPGSFDAVVSVFGLFFIEDMSALLARAWTWLGEDGHLAITAWGQEVLAPGEAWFWEAVEAEAPSLRGPAHAARLDTPEKIEAVFRAAGLPAPRIEHGRWDMPLRSPESFWPVIMGTSNRGAYESLTEAQQARVRARVTGALRAAQVQALAMDVLYATVRRP